MRVLKVLSYPGLILFGLAAGYVIATGQANRELLSLLLATAFGSGELIVSAMDAVAGTAFSRILPRLLNACGALMLAAATFVSEPFVVLTAGSLILTAGLLLLVRQLRQDRLDRPTH